MVLYVDSKGNEHVIATMNPMKLLNALNALKRDGWSPSKFSSQEEHDACIVEMEAQAAINRAAYIGELEAEHNDPATPADRKAEIATKLAELAQEGAQ